MNTRGSFKKLLTVIMCIAMIATYTPFTAYAF